MMAKKPLLLPPQDGELTLDGAFGEGGGQILRTTLALSAAVGRTVRIHNVRAGRKKPGLAEQHRRAVLSLAELCGADVRGVNLGSTHLRFAPSRPVETGVYRFTISTAGSAPLLLHALVPALVCARADAAQPASRLILRGGTHVPTSPSYGYLERVWAPAARACGIDLSVSLGRPGFYPAGGGEISASVTAGRPAVRATWLQRQGPPIVRAFAGVSRLPTAIAERMLQQVARRLDQAGVPFSPQQHGVVIDHGEGALSPAAYIELVLDGPPLPAGFVALGRRGLPAEAVADQATSDLLAHLATDAPVDPHLADQLLLLLALSTDEGRFRTSLVTEHLLTHAEVLRTLWPVQVTVQGALGEVGEVTVRPSAEGAADQPIP